MKILINRSQYINTYWNFYIGVATFVLGLVLSGKFSINRVTKKLLLVSFLLFTVSNLLSIINLNEQRELLISNINLVYSVMAEAFKPDHKLSYILFHLTLDITVLTIVWRTKEEEEKR